MGEASYGCIYLITNTYTKRQYVGRTKYPTPYRRFYQHMAAVRRKVDTPLIRDIRKYGRDNFTVETLCTAKHENLDNMEAYWAEQLETYIWDKPLFHPRGYNAILCGTYTKPQLSYTGRRPAPHVMAALNANRRHAWKGRKHRPESIAKMSACHRGKKLTDRHKGILRANLLGKTLDTERVEAARQNRIESIIEKGAKGVKLTKEDVLQIVVKAEAGASYTEIAAEFSVQISVISRIMSGDRWGYVTGIAKVAPTPRNHPKLGMDNAIKIREVYATGNYTYNSLAEQFSVDKSTIASIVKYKLYPVESLS